MVQLKMTAKQLINTHCDTLSQLSISKLISHLASITCKERLGDDLGGYQMGNSSEVWGMGRTIIDYLLFL